MKFVFNDLTFFYSFKNEYSIKDAIDNLVDVFLYIRKHSDNIQLIYNKNNIIHNQELMPQYPMAKIYNKKIVSQDKIRIILQYFSKMKYYMVIIAKM